MLIDQTGRCPYPPKARRQLNENTAAPGMDTLGKVPPAGKVGAGAVDPGEVGAVFRLCHGGIDAVADGDESGGEKSHTAGGPGEKVLKHFIVGPTALLCHLQIAHRGHDYPVFDGQAIDPNGGEEHVIGIKCTGHSCRTSRAVFAVSLYPITVAIYQFLD